LRVATLVIELSGAAGQRFDQTDSAVSGINVNQSPATVGWRWMIAQVAQAVSCSALRVLAAAA
jgi:hypothetical protein